MRSPIIGVLVPCPAAAARPERAVRDVLAALRARRLRARLVPVDRDLGGALGREPIDLAFLALEGRAGDDGAVQATLEAAGVPHTGPTAPAAALAGDRARAREILRRSGLPTPPSYRLPAGLSAARIAELHGDLGYPVLIRPARRASPVAASLAIDAAGLAAACAHTGDDLLVERVVSGPRIRIALLDGRPLGAEVSSTSGPTPGRRAHPRTSRSEKPGTQVPAIPAATPPGRRAPSRAARSDQPEAALRSITAATPPGRRAPSRAARSDQPEAALRSITAATPPGGRAPSRAARSDLSRAEPQAITAAAPRRRSTRTLASPAGLPPAEVVRARAARRALTVGAAGSILGVPCADAAALVGVRRLEGIVRQAAAAARVLGLRGAALVEIALDPGGNELVLDVDPSPCLARGARFARIARDAGTGFEELIAVIAAGVAPIDQPLAA